MVIFVFLFPLLLLADIDVLLDQSIYYETQPITGVVQITTAEKNTIDEHSFKLDGKTLEVTFDKKTDFPGKEPVKMMSYRFKIPAESKGLKVFPAVTVSINGKKETSSPLSYEVKALQASATTNSAYLKLENIYEGPTNLYPGTKIVLGYRYLFKGAVDLDVEDLPLLDKAPFQRLGEKIINDSETGEMSIREIRQSFKVEQIGTTTFPKSEAKGYSYQIAPNGSKIYQQPALVSETPSLTIKVNPFPEKDKPPFFTGAVGPFSIEAKADAPPVLKKGDRIKYSLVFKGDEFTSLKAPQLLCQPGFNGNFTLSDLPPEKDSDPHQRTISYELRLLNDQISSIPPVYFAYFDPNKINYEVIHTQAVPLKVTPELIEAKRIDIKEGSPQAELKKMQTLGEPIEMIRPPKWLSNPYFALALLGLFFYRYRKKTIDPVNEAYNETIRANDNDRFYEHAMDYFSLRKGTAEQNAFKDKMQAWRYGKESYSLSDLKEEFKKLTFLFLFIPASILGTFYEEETSLNKQLNESLINEEWSRAALYFEALDKPYEAIYYYEKALKVNPWNYNLKNAVDAIRDKNEIQTKDYPFPIPMEFLVAAISFVLIASLLYRPLIWGAIVLIPIALIFHYLSPIQAILLNADSLRMEPFEEATSVKLVKAGEKVEVIGEEKEGHYLKIKDSEGKIGYILFEKIRII